jgi:hypothetical protein
MIDGGFHGQGHHGGRLGWKERIMQYGHFFED